MARKGHTNVIYKGTFICKQTLCSANDNVSYSKLDLNTYVVDLDNHLSIVELVTTENCRKSYWWNPFLVLLLSFQLPQFGYLYLLIAFWFVFLSPFSPFCFYSFSFFILSLFLLNILGVSCLVSFMQKSGM